MMRKDPWNVVGLALALSLVMVAGCGGADGDDDDDDDACAGKVLCTVEGTSCDGDTVVTCAQDGAGCLVETAEDCSASGLVCDDTGADAMCVDGECSDDTLCDGATDGDTYCDGDTVVTCAAGADGCLDASTEDCSTAGDVCDDSAAPAICVCTDDTECAGASDGDSFCDGDSTVDCDLDGDGCLVATVVDCSAGGDVCDDSGADAVCTAACTDHPSCTGATEGDTSCAGAFLNTCTDTDADGCLDLVQENCTPGLCDDSATPECGVVAATGETCADPIPVLSSSFALSGADFTADFADDVVLADASCINRPAGSVDAVFSIDLATGDTVVVEERGGLDSTRNIQTTCGDAQVCEASLDDPDTQALTYTATADGTVFIVVEAYFATPSTTDYDIAISLNPTCGNGLVEAGEACDDGDVVDGNGCSAACAVEFGYSCDGLSPTTCDAYPDLGTFGVGDPIADTVNGDLVPAGDSDFYTITFTEDVLLSGTLVANGTGDVDLFMFNADSTAGLTAADVGDEAWTDVFIPADTYVIVVNVWSGDADADLGYTLSMSSAAIPDLGTLGDGGTATETGGALPAGDSDFYTITFSEDVLLTGTLTGMGGADMDLYLFGPGGDFITASADDADETFGIALFAGTYTVLINAWDGAADATGWTLDVSAATLAVPDIGAFGAEDTIADTVGGPITARAFDHYTITFTEDVLLSGTLGGNTTGSVGIRLYDADAALISSFTGADEVFTDEAVPAGTYIVQVLTSVLGGGDVDGYTLSLTANAP